MTLVLTGTVVTFDDERRVLPRGAVYMNGGVIEAVAPARKRPPAGYADAPRVAAGGLIPPGLIDLHNHLAYNFIPLWSAPREAPYGTRYQWPGAATYGRDISNPAQAMGITAAAAALRYAEVKAVVGGVTSIQGSPPLTRPFPGWMVRNIEKETFADRPGQLVYQAVLQATRDQLDNYASQLQRGHSFIYHLAEGTDPKLREEYTALREAHCVHEQLIGIHSTALAAEDFDDWGHTPGAVVWSPFSNIWLYGDTTDIVAARRRGIRVCLGSDWAPSGTRNLLGELKVAEVWNRVALAGALTDQELCELATREPGLTLERAWGRPVGRLVEGALADVLVTAKRAPDPYRSLLDATERSVRMVVVDGRPVYGTRSLLEKAGATDLERITVAGVARAIRMKLPPEMQPDDPDLADLVNLSWKDGLARLEAVRRDPAGEVRRARSARGFGPAPLEFIPDMPAAGDGTVGARELTDEELDSLVIAPLDGLAHDRAWFDRVDEGHAHAAVLKELRAAFA
jgi:cytosine/adenosine deaminase-related metal-dependent hydrolase